MKHIITALSVRDVNAPGALFIPLDIIPGAGTLSTDTSEDGQTREINLSQKLRWSDKLPSILTADVQIKVEWYDGTKGRTGSMTIGSDELPARIQVGDTAVRTITCRHTELI